MTKKRIARKVASRDEFKPIKCEVAHFSKDLAQKVTEMPFFDGERKIRDDHVLHLAEEMEKGNFLWREAGIALARCSWDNELRRVNGNHTCNARLLLDGKSPDIQVTTYRVRTEEEFRRLYSKFDRNAARTSGHVTDIRLIGTPQFADVNRSVLSKLAQGYKSWTGLRNPDIVADKLLYDHNAVAMKVVPIVELLVSNKNHIYLRRAPVIGAMFETFSKCTKDSQEFWDSVITGLGFTSAKDPAKVLREWLQTHTLKNSYGSARRVQTVSSEHVYRACILAFNKFRGGEEMQVVKASNTKRRPRAR